MKRFRAPGNPGEYGDWIVGVATLPADDEPSVASALQEILAAVQDIEAFMRLPDGSQALHYTLRFSRDGELRDLIDERSFWPKAVMFPALRPLVVEYIQRVNREAESENWQDEYHPRGSFAIAELALVDCTACSLLGELLFTWDMGHETFQEGLIDQLFGKHGLNQHTLDLLACRTLADGQAIEPQIAAALYDHEFKKHMELSDFAQCCALKVGLSVCPDLGLDHFAQIYAAGDAFTHQVVWAAFRAAGIEESPEEFDPEESETRARNRTARLTENWDSEFLDSSVESFAVNALEPITR